MTVINLKKHHHISLRLTDDEYKKLAELQKHLSTSEYIRLLIDNEYKRINGEFIAPFTEEFTDLKRLLLKIIDTYDPIETSPADLNEMNKHLKTLIELVLILIKSNPIASKSLEKKHLYSKS